MSLDSLNSLRTVHVMSFFPLNELILASNKHAGARHMRISTNQAHGTYQLDMIHEIRVQNEDSITQEPCILSGNGTKRYQKITLADLSSMSASRIFFVS